MILSDSDDSIVLGMDIEWEKAPIAKGTNDEKVNLERLFDVTSFGRCKFSIERICVFNDCVCPLLKLEEIVLKT